MTLDHNRLPPGYYWVRLRSNGPKRRRVMELIDGQWLIMGWDIPVKDMAPYEVIGPVETYSPPVVKVPAWAVKGRRKGVEVWLCQGVGPAYWAKPTGRKPYKTVRIFLCRNDAVIAQECDRGGGYVPDARSIEIVLTSVLVPKKTEERNE